MDFHSKSERSSPTATWIPLSSKTWVPSSIMVSPLSVNIIRFFFISHSTSMMPLFGVLQSGGLKIPPKTPLLNQSYQRSVSISTHLLFFYLIRLHFLLLSSMICSSIAQYLRNCRCDFVYIVRVQRAFTQTMHIRRLLYFPPSRLNFEGDICKNLLNARLNWEKLLKPLWSAISVIGISVERRSVCALRTLVMEI